MSAAVIQQAVNFMEEHILEDIDYVQVARAVHMSAYSFHRAFSFIVGMTANEYIRARRLSLAGQELRSSGISVIDAAYKYGYSSPENFSRAFSRFHGSSPRQARRMGARLRLFDPLVVKITIGGGTIMEYRIEHRGPQEFIAVKRAFSNEASLDASGRSIPEFWEECRERGLTGAMEELRPQGSRDLYGLCAPLSSSETEFDYGIGVRIDDGTDRAGVERLLACGQGYGIWATAPADYAVFRCFGPDGDCLGEAWDRFFKEFCPQTGYSQTDDTDYEVYFQEPEKGLFCELWVPVGRGRG